MRTIHADRRGGFSIVELLVVISIIAVLLAMLLPALKAARESARLVKCKSGLHQLLVATHAYSNDYRGSLPLPNWGPSAQRAGWLYDQTVGPAVGKAFGESDRETGALYAYLEAGPIYRCPSHDGPFEGTAVMTSYIMNGALVAYHDANASFRIDLFRGNAVMMWDANEQGSVAFNDGASYPSEIESGHHGDGITCGVVDGSSIYLDGQAFASNVETRPSRLWCNPSSRTGD